LHETTKLEKKMKKEMDLMGEEKTLEEAMTKKQPKLFEKR